MKNRTLISWYFYENKKTIKYKIASLFVKLFGISPSAIFVVLEEYKTLKKDK